ncbi:MAG: hypothetical protein H8E31_10965 [Planctomycetes bacterium]|nr:hypothetical protein [Planctomycetota bacterium]
MSAPVRSLALALTLLLSLPACDAALVGAGVALGVWAHDENSDDGGTIVLPHQPDVVLRVAEAVAQERGTEIDLKRGSRRIEFVIDDVNVKIHVLEIMGRPDVAELKIRARSLWRSRGDLAEDLAVTIQDRLE